MKKTVIKFAAILSLAITGANLTAQTANAIILPEVIVYGVSDLSRFFGTSFYAPRVGSLPQSWIPTDPFSDNAFNAGYSDPHYEDLQVLPSYSTDYANDPTIPLIKLLQWVKRGILSKADLDTIMANPLVANLYTSLKTAKISANVMRTALMTVFDSMKIAHDSIKASTALGLQYSGSIHAGSAASGISFFLQIQNNFVSIGHLAIQFTNPTTGAVTVWTSNATGIYSFAEICEWMIFILETGGI